MKLMKKNKWSYPAKGFWLITFDFIDDKNKETLKKIIEAVLMRTKEHSELCCVIWAYNWIL